VELYPAVDVQGGRVARSASPDDPVAVARQFARDGARWVHFVDLDRALGTGENRELARRFLAGAGAGGGGGSGGSGRLAVQVGGALGTEAAIAEMLAWGASRVVIGTRAAIDEGVVARLLARHGAARLAVGIDTRDGRVAARGEGGGGGAATTRVDVSPVELARRVLALGARTAIYTDAARDGTLAGPDLDGARAIARLGLDVIVSGGVASLDDLRRAAAAGLAGAIVGRALHEGRFTLAEALACVAG
jgi:phosphoribosylformimino-5-aminoimidazole carboxamide ribotide isomerase